MFKNELQQGLGVHLILRDDGAQPGEGSHCRHDADGARERGQLPQHALPCHLQHADLLRLRSCSATGRGCSPALLPLLNECWGSTILMQGRCAAGSHVRRLVDRKRLLSALGACMMPTLVTCMHSSRASKNKPCAAKCKSPHPCRLDTAPPACAGASYPGTVPHAGYPSPAGVGWCALCVCQESGLSVTQLVVERQRIVLW